jgi:hypothetical protein
MILVGILRTKATQLLSSSPKPDLANIREKQALNRSRILRQNYNQITKQDFNQRKEYLIKAFNEREYLKVKDYENQQNLMENPDMMNGTMEMLKKNMMMVIPQTLIMSWISYFFSGFVLTKLPFPLTLRFKQIVQRGIETKDMDVQWVSSISWYFLNLFGLSSIYTLLLGQGMAMKASGSMDMMMQTQQNPIEQPAEVAKLFKAEVEFLQLLEYKNEFKEIRERVYLKYGNHLNINSKKIQ